MKNRGLRKFLVTVLTVVMVLSTTSVVTFAGTGDWDAGDGYGSVEAAEDESVRLRAGEGSASGPFTKDLVAIKDGSDLSYGFFMDVILDFDGIKAGEDAAWSFAINDKNGNYLDEAFVKIDCFKDNKAVVSQVGSNSAYDNAPLLENPIGARGNEFYFSAVFTNNNGKLHIDYIVNDEIVRSWDTDKNYSDVKGPRYGWAYDCDLEAGILVTCEPETWILEHMDYAEEVEAEKATCTKDGNIECWYCEHCDKYFSDEELTKELSEEDIVIKATGHDFKNGKCTVCGAKDPDFNAGAVVDGDKDNPINNGDADKNNTVKATDAKDKSADTGDNTNLIMPIALAITALTGIVAVVATRRRHN